MDVAGFAGIQRVALLNSGESSYIQRWGDKLADAAATAARGGHRGDPLTQLMQGGGAQASHFRIMAKLATGTAGTVD